MSQQATMRHEYEAAITLHKQDPPFYALVMAAMLGADTHNAELLRAAFPEVRAELQERYDTPGGTITRERSSS